VLDFRFIVQGSGLWIHNPLARVSYLDERMERRTTDNMDPNRVDDLFHLEVKPRFMLSALLQLLQLAHSLPQHPTLLLVDESCPASVRD
jgi:hypothetical protein